MSEAQEPFAEVYQGHAPLMRFMAIRDYNVPSSDAESIVHDVFMRYFSNPGVVRGDLRPYFRGAVRNGCLEYWRNRKREDSVFDAACDAAVEQVTDGTSLADTVAVRLAVTETLARLRPRCSDALRRFHFEGKSMEVIAEELDVAPLYVRQLLSHCRKTARRIFDGFMWTPADINTLFLRLSRRAESVDRSKLVETFVDVGPLFTLLSSTDHQVIYGRRGTGKTHALLYLDSSARSKGSLAIYVDLRTIGSTGGLYSDPSVPLPERATRLLMDTLAAIHDSLLEQVLANADLDLQRLGPAMDRLAGSITEVVVTGTVQTEESASESVSERRTASGGLSITSDNVTGDIRNEELEEASVQQASRVTRSGTAQHRVHFGRVGNALRDVLSALAPRRIWILLDEWSVVPAELQPYLADLLRRSLFPLPGVTVKLGCIEQRTHLQLTGTGGDYVGIEIGADASADVNLDDFMVFENDPERATRFFQELIFKHVRALEGEYEAARELRNAGELMQRAFTQRNTFEEFVRASEGVPRDAINILSLSAQRALDGQISMEDVRAAAKAWYQRDKEAAASANAEAKLLLHWIIDEVIAHRRARGFLLRTGDQHLLIDALFDARVLHILKRNISSHDQPGARYDAYKIDYGCYVDLLTTIRSPHGLLLAGDADADMKYVDVPPDDYRAIRRAILDLEEFEKSKAATSERIQSRGHAVPSMLFEGAREQE